MMRCWAVAAGTTWLFFGCSPAAPSPTNAGVGDPVTPIASATESDEPASTNGPETPVDKEASKLLTKLDEAKGELRLYQVGAAVIATESVDESTETETKRFTRIGAVTGGKIAWRKELELGYEAQGIKDIEGTWPESMWLTYMFDYGRSADQVQYASTKAGWVAKSKRSSYVDFWFESTTLPDGSIVGVSMREMKAGRLGVVHGLAKPPVMPKSEACGAEGAFVSTVDATEKGTLIGIGTCAGRYVAVVWPPDKTEGTFHFFELPVDERSVHGPLLFKGRGDSAWAWLGDKVAHFRDGAWSAIEKGPVLGTDHDVAYGPGGGVELANGELWVDSGNSGKLFRRTAAGAYAIVELPPRVSLNGLAIQDGKVLLAASNLLLGEGTGGVDWSQVKLDEKREKRVIGAEPASPACRNNVVVLYGFTKVTPDDYDFPLTRKALKGQKSFSDVTFAVTREAGQKFFVGLTPTFKRAEALRSVIEKGVQGSSPQIVCAKPELLRELKIDLATGELAK